MVLITGATTIPVTGITSIDAMGTPLSAEQIEAKRRAAGATPGQAGTSNAGAQSTPLPAYLYLDENMVVPYRGTTNSQMVDTLRLLKLLITDEDYDVV